MNRTLLLVEDNPGDAELIIELLARQQTDDEVLHVDTLAAAVSRLERAPVDAVLLDLKLPDGSGVECVSRIRAVRDELPIVVLTGLDDDTLAVSCIRAGAQDYLSKNEIRTQVLSRAIGYAIARSAETHERRRADSLQARLAAIVEASSDAIVSCTPGGLVTSWNESASRIFGVPARDAMGGPVRELLPCFDELAGHLDTKAAGLAIQRPWTRRDGTAFTLSLVTSALRDAGGRTTGVAAIYRDITEQKTLEARLAIADRMVSIGTLAAGVAHEINNPLGSVIVNLELIAQQIAELATVTDLMEKLTDEVRDAREGAERVRRIVQDLKIFSRAEGDDELGPVDLRQTVESTLRLAANEIKHRARLVQDLQELPPVHANAARLGQVLLNLLVNAAQAIPEGHHDENQITVSTRMDEHGRVRLSVADTGVGMTPEVKHKLFTAFFTTKPVGVGTGLGLAICQRIVSTFGGEITFESDPAWGSRFVVTLSVEATKTPHNEALDLVDANVRRARVLVIDDETALLRATKRVLSEHDVTCHDNAADALALLAAGEAFDVILCDMMMPNMGGASFYRAVTALDRGIESRIVFMTGGAFAPEAAAFLHSVPNRHIEKPFSRVSLLALVREMAK